MPSCRSPLHPRRPPRPRRRLAAPGAALLPLLLGPCLLLAAAPPAAAQGLPCAPCAGIRVAGPAAAAETAAAAAAAAAAQGGGLDAESPLLVAWDVELAPLAGDPAATAEAAGATARAAEAVRAAGALPWITLRFATPPPLRGNSPALDAEIAAASAVARGAGDAFYQLAWRPAAGSGDGAAEYAYLAKRAAVAVSGAASGARVASRPLPADPAALAALYAEEVGGYLDAVAFAPAPPAGLRALADALTALDPGRLTVVEAPFPAAAPARALATAAANAVAGAAVTLFDAGGLAAPPAAEALAPLVLLARELSGDLAHDPYSSPAAAGGGEAWSFVRGSDLGLRVIALAPRTAAGEPVDELTVTFPDPQLRNPQRVRLDNGETIPLADVRRTAEGLEVRVADPGPAVVLRLERVGVEELGAGGGLAEEVTVASERRMPVEEILRRLQAFEDAQERRLDHFSATNTTHLRFGVGAGSVGGFEATFEGPFFYDPETGVDWAWEALYVNGVRWRGRSIPEIPLVQPEKAAALPGQITFDKTYRYRLRGTEVVDGRDTWVVEFEPAVPVAAAAAGGLSLYRGAVWVDREVFARVRTRAVQLGLRGEVISNEETLHFGPVDAAGEALPWGAGEAYVLPLRLVAQQLLSVLNGTTLVERETRYTGLSINGEGFEERRAAVMASDVTMVRDTAEGLRYLVPDEDGEGRVVKEGFDTDKWFVVGGLFWDDSLDYPLPLGGVNYLDLDFRDRGGQLNVFFAGALLAVNVAEPRLFGSRFDAGVDLFGIAVPLADSVYRDGEEIEGEEVESRPLTAAVKLGRPLGSFTKLSAQYRLRQRDFGSTDETADGFAVPADHLEHELSLGGRVSRFGWSLGLDAAWAMRSEWEPWGFAGNPGFDPEHEDYLTWGASLAKSWYLPRFQKIGTELVYVDGEDLDRFSKYEFGFFGDTRVHGYRSGRVKAESAWLARASYGFEIGKLLRLDAQLDTAWATDEESGLSDELLAGVGLAGTFVGPWQTLINLDVGTPVAGPDDGVVAYVVFLKLFD
jgi:hypothetical protein